MAPLVEFHKEVYSIEVLIDHVNGYNGYKSNLGETLFDARK